MHWSQHALSPTRLLHSQREVLPLQAWIMLLNSSIALLLLVFVAAGTQGFAYFHYGNSKTEHPQGPDGKQRYVVYMGARPETVTAEALVSSNQNMLARITGSEDEARASILHTYKHSFGGFSGWLTDSQAEALSKEPGVAKVFKSRKLQLHTTRSWDFLGFHNTELDPAFSQGSSGKGDVIIGLLDTGIWPEAESFSDEGLGPVPAKWKGGCDNSKVVNPSHAIHCNKKLIGAKSYDLHNAPNGTFIYHNARDEAGHGTHTSATAGGRVVKGANFFGLANGTAKGGLPGARLAMYKVCYGYCYGDALLAAFDDAIHEGVDVISLSIGGDPLPYDEDSIAIGSFHAAANGILVSCSAGNSGPVASTLSNAAPWLLTVGASGIDRSLAVVAKLGNGKELHGTGHNLKTDAKPSKVISGSDAVLTEVGDASLCSYPALNVRKMKGATLVCSTNNGLGYDANFANVEAAGAIFTDDKFGEVFFPTAVPSAVISGDDFDDLLNYTRTSNATVSISHTSTVCGTTAPTVAGFSSRGPNTISPDILKPDVLAPGLNILAAWPPISPIFTQGDGQPVYSEYNIISGTSMACPHATGVAAYVKSVHPDWSPAAIKSALMTTADLHNNKGTRIKDYNGATASLFATGAGEISPEKAINPGLVYDASVEDYVAYLCASGYNTTQLRIISGQAKISCEAGAKAELNYPSIAIPELSSGKATVKRTVTNVGRAVSTYKMVSNAPRGIKMRVSPRVLRFTALGQKLSYTVELEATPSKETAEWRFGFLTWHSGSIAVRSPIAIHA